MREKERKNEPARGGGTEKGREGGRKREKNKERGKNERKKRMKKGRKDGWMEEERQAGSESTGQELRRR